MPELTELLKDKERLDWLESGEANQSIIEWSDDHSTGRITRKSIDAAMSSKMQNVK